MSASTSSKHTLYDLPVSNNGARVRIILYKKQIPETEVSIVSPMILGGLKTPEYLALNPQGKMPLLQSPTMAIPESDTICRYLLSEYANLGPSFQPDAVKSNLIARLHDVYLGPIQGCLYKASPPFGMFGTRSKALEEFQRQLRVINDLVSEGSTYLIGEEVSLADATLFPTMVFANVMFPQFGIMPEQAFPPPLKAWFDGLPHKDEVFAKVKDEIEGGLTSWEGKGRWDTIHLAGVKDTDPPTIFEKIVAGEIPATTVRDTEDILAFKDINPAAPAHVLIIPKNRDGLTRLRRASLDHVEILGKMLVMAGDIASDESLGFGPGARVVINDGEEGGQEVFHLHMHVLGGRKMVWPPG